MPLDTSPGGTYTTPDSDESPQLDYWLGDLAEQVESHAVHHTGPTRRRVHITDPMTGTTDASGYCTFTHGAPFTPSFVQVQIVKNAFSLGYVISTDPPTATQVTARFGSWSATTTLNSQALGAGAIRLVCWE